MKIFMLLFYLTSFMPLQSSSTVIKSRTVRGRDTTDIKKKVGAELDQILTLSSSLIASLSKQIDAVVKKIKQLVSGNDTFFSPKKVKELEQYRQQLRTMRTRLEKVISETEKDLHMLMHGINPKLKS